MTNPEETMKMFRDSNKYDIVPCIEEDKTPTSDPEENLPVNVIPDEEESARKNEKKIHQILRTTIKRLTHKRQHMIE